MKNIRSIVFFGTHELAVPALETLAGLDLPPRLIVTRPLVGLPGSDGDEPPHPVLGWAREKGVETVRSRHADEPELAERVAALEPDLIVEVDYGRPLPSELVELAPRGAITVHPSLLPKLRGEYALRTALTQGDNKTGVTVIQVNDEPWGGPILFQEELAIDPHETFGDLWPRVAELAGDLLTQALKKIDRSKKKPKGRAQNDKISTTTAELEDGHRRTPWTLEAGGVYDRLRAFSPPGLVAYCRYRPVEILAGLPMEWVQAPYGETGTYLGMRQGKLAVLCGGSTVFGITRLRRPGQESQGASDFARAEELQVGDRFV